jgi:hypothetical protein
VTATADLPPCLKAPCALRTVCILRTHAPPARTCGSVAIMRSRMPSVMNTILLPPVMLLAKRICGRHHHEGTADSFDRLASSGVFRAQAIALWQQPLRLPQSASNEGHRTRKMDLPQSASNEDHRTRKMDHRPTLYATSDPWTLSVSCATRRHSEMAEMRRGCVHTMRLKPPLTRNWGTCVLLPQPALARGGAGGGCGVNA